MIGAIVVVNCVVGCVVGGGTVLWVVTPGGRVALSVVGPVTWMVVAGGVVPVFMSRSQVLGIWSALELSGKTS